MLSRNRYGINNLLIRRLRRHAKLTTLFRPLDEPIQVHSRQPRTISRYEPAGPAGIRPVQAYLIADPTPYAINSPPKQLGRHNPAEKTSDDADQANWRRLQAIFRAHEHKADLTRENRQSGEEERMKFAETRPVQRNLATTEPRPQTLVIKSGTERSASGPSSQDAAQKLGNPGPQTSSEAPTSHQAEIDTHEGETGQRIEFEPGTSLTANESEAGLEQSESELPPVSGLQAQPLQAAWPVQPLQPESIVKTKHEQNGEPAAMSGVKREIQEEAHPDAPPADNSTLQMVMEQTPSGKPSASSVEQISPRRPRPQPSSTTEVEPLAREEDEVMESDSEERHIFTPEKDPYSVQESEFLTENDLASESESDVDAAAITQAKVSFRDLNYEQPRTTSQAEQQTSSAAESVPKELQKEVSASKGEIPGSQQNRTLRAHAPTEPSPAHIQRRLEPPSGGRGGELGRVEMSPIEAGSIPQAFIPTEVGPLPADLWDLLDQPRPSNEKTGLSSATGSHYKKAGIPVQRQVKETSLEDNRQTGTLPLLQAAARPAPKPPLASSSRIESEPGGEDNPIDSAMEKAGKSLPSQLPDLPAVSVENIQRKPDETGEAPRPGSETLSSTGSEARGERGIDLDELARRVYAEVRARLTVDRERLRR